MKCVVYLLNSYNVQRLLYGDYKIQGIQMTLGLLKSSAINLENGDISIVFLRGDSEMGASI